MAGQVVILSPQALQHHLLVAPRTTLCGRSATIDSATVNLEAARNWTRACKICFPDGD